MFVPGPFFVCYGLALITALAVRTARSVRFPLTEASQRAVGAAERAGLIHLSRPLPLAIGAIAVISALIGFVPLLREGNASLHFLWPPLGAALALATGIFGARSTVSEAGRQADGPTDVDRRSGGTLSAWTTATVCSVSGAAVALALVTWGGEGFPYLLAGVQCGAFLLCAVLWSTSAPLEAVNSAAESQEQHARALSSLVAVGWLRPLASSALLFSLSLFLHGQAVGWLVADEPSGPRMAIYFLILSAGTLVASLTFGLASQVSNDEPLQLGHARAGAGALVVLLCSIWLGEGRSSDSDTDSLLPFFTSLLLILGVSAALLPWPLLRQTRLAPRLESGLRGVVLCVGLLFVLAVPLRPELASSHLGLTAALAVAAALAPFGTLLQLCADAREASEPLALLAVPTPSSPAPTPAADRNSAAIRSEGFLLLWALLLAPLGLEPSNSSHATLVATVTSGAILLTVALLAHLHLLERCEERARLELMTDSSDGAGTLSRLVELARTEARPAALPVMIVIFLPLGLSAALNLLTHETSSVAGMRLGLITAATLTLGATLGHQKGARASLGPLSWATAMAALSLIQTQWVAH